MTAPAPGVATATAPTPATHPTPAVEQELRPRGKARRARQRAAQPGDGKPPRNRRNLIAWSVVVGVVAICAVIIAVVQPRTSGVPFAPDNPDAIGGRAMAQILGNQGVDVRFVKTTDEALAELAAAPDTATLLVAGDYGMTADQSRTLVDKSAATVLIAPGPDLMQTFAPDLTPDYLPGSPGAITARCDDPDATAAEQIGPTYDGYRTDGTRATELCFGVGGIGAMARSGSTSVLASAEPFTNDNLTEYGNAALGLRVLGGHERLVWFIPDWSAMYDGSDDYYAATGPGLPDWIGPIGLLLLLTVILLAWNRGPRFGRVIAERLPVVVSAKEIVHGRARLYRRARDYAHAAALIRAGALAEIAHRLGLPPSARRDTIVPTIASATGRDPFEVDHLLYGPDPRTSAELTELSTRINHLRREVNPT